MVRQLWTRWKYFALALLIILSSVVTLTTPQSAIAASPSDIETSVKKYLNYQALMSCVYDTDSRASGQDIIDWKFFEDFDEGVGAIIAPGGVDCEDTGWLRGVVGEYGHTDPVDLLCAAGWSSGEGVVHKTQEECRSYAPRGLRPPSNRSEAFKSALLKSTPEPGLNDADKYYLYSQTFIQGCSASIIGEYATASSSDRAIPGTDRGYLLKAPNANYVATEYIYQTDKAKSDIASTASVQSDGRGGDVSAHCVELVASANNLINAYINAIKPGVGQPGTCGEKYVIGPVTSPSGPGGLRAACDDGYANKANTQFCSKYDASAAGPLLGGLSDDGKTLFGIPAPNFTDTFYACLYGNRTATGNSSSTSPPLVPPGSGPATDTTTCNIEGIGFLVCPFVRLLAGIADGAYGVIESLLEVQPLIITGAGSEGGRGVYNAWQVMRNFANVAFIIAFLVIVYSQVTSAGVSNYGIKRMLPRLIIAAILVNASFWICAAGVDLSNILGSSLQNLFENLAMQINVPETPWGGGDAGNFQSIVGYILAIAGTGAAGAAGAAFAVNTIGWWGLIGLIAPVLLAVVLIVVAVVVLLLLRQAAIILLVVISPLAFVAFLLPNTEAMFNRWRSAFVGLLVLFPYIALAYGAGQFASRIILASST